MINFSKSAPKYELCADIQKKMREKLISLLPDHSAKVLDIGCGTGVLAHRLSNKYRSSRIYGIDIAEGMIRAASSRFTANNIKFINADGESLPFSDAEFDLVVSNASLQWMDEKKALSEAARVLKPGGLFIFSTFGPKTLNELRSAGFSINHFPSKEGLAAITLSHFSEVRLTGELIKMNYRGLFALLNHLKEIGAKNPKIKKHKGLMTRKKISSLFCGSENEIKVSYDVICGRCIK